MTKPLKNTVWLREFDQTAFLEDFKGDFKLNKTVD